MCSNLLWFDLEIHEINEKTEHGWVAVLTGKIGSPSASGFVLLEPNVQVFEKKPKPEVGVAPH